MPNPECIVLVFPGDTLYEAIGVISCPRSAQCGLQTSLQDNSPVIERRVRIEGTPGTFPAQKAGDLASGYCPRRRVPPPRQPTS